MSEDLLVQIRMEEFKQRAHSLRLSASRISALAGFHPFANLPELLMNLVYQGGQELLRMDALLLGIEIRSEEAILLELAKKASVETSKALQSALQVKTGKRKVDSVTKADQVKQQVVEEAKNSKKLSAVELKTLQEGVRSSVDTGYGTYHEDAALDLYERQCGWNVRERNASIMAWPFAKIEDLSGNEAVDTPTVVPMSNARMAHRMASRETKTAQDSNDSANADSKAVQDADDTNGNKESKLLLDEEQSGSASDEGELAPVETLQKTADCSATENTRPTSQVATRDKAMIAEQVSPKFESSNVKTSGEPASSDATGTAQLSSSPRPTLPFFTIYGAVDGIRDELYPPPPDTKNVSLFDEEWQLRQVIVECKHRMKKTFASPPLYDMIQTTAYCLMYNVDHADIAQVVRTSKESTESCRKVQKRAVESTDTVVDRKGDGSVHSKSNDEGKAPAIETDCEASTSKTDHDIKKTNDMTASVNEESCKESGSEPLPIPNNKQADATKETDSQLETDTDHQSDKINGPKQATTIEIDVKRVSLDDPLLNHRHNWSAIVLPRLRSFVEAVYRIRADDNRRYRLLASMSDPTGNQLEAWNFLHEELPWLKDCDTAFHRDY